MEKQDMKMTYNNSILGYMVGTYEQPTIEITSIID